MEDKTEQLNPLGMERTSRMNLPGRRRGLSMYYSEKSRTFECIANVHCLDDLKKHERPIIKGRKKELEEMGPCMKEHQIQSTPPTPCRPPSITNLCASPVIRL